MVYSNPQAVCASVAMAFPKGPGKYYRLVVVFSPINYQCDLVPRRMKNLEFEGEKCAGSKAFCTMDCLQEYWPCPGRGTGVVHFCDAGRAVLPDAGASGCHECHIVLPGDHDNVLGDLVGRTCLIYVNDMKVLGWMVAELVADLREVLLRFMERRLFLAAHTLVLYTGEVK